MKKQLLLILSFLFVIVMNASAQRINNLVIYCNEGEKFVLILNGQKYNEIPATTVTAEGLDLKAYGVKIIFENTSIRQVDDEITFNSTNKECVFALAQKNKRKYELAYISSKNITPEVPNHDNIDANRYSTGNSTNTNTNNNTNTNTNNNTNTNTNTTYSNTTYPSNSTTVYPSNSTTVYPSNTTTSTNTNTTSNNNNSISINHGNIKVGVNDNGTIKVGNGLGNVNLNAKDKGGNLTLGNGMNGITLNKAFTKTGCATAMYNTEFEALKKNLATVASDTTKLMAATDTAIQNHCFATDQVKEMIKNYPTDAQKFQFAKKAYHHTHDLSNFHQLKDSFKTEETQDDLHQFIKDQK